MSIQIYYEEEGFKLKGWRKTVKVIEAIIGQENKIAGDVSFIISGDEEILKINKEFLGHDYYTDVITFNYNVDDIVSGEVYISRDTVKENAKEFNVPFREELLRVIIHGVLHLMGMDDSDEAQRDLMHDEEDKWLQKLKF